MNCSPRTDSLCEESRPWKNLRPSRHDRRGASQGLFEEARTIILQLGDVRLGEAGDAVVSKGLCGVKGFAGSGRVPGLRCLLASLDAHRQNDLTQLSNKQASDGEQPGFAGSDLTPEDQEQCPSGVVNRKQGLTLRAPFFAESRICSEYFPASRGRTGRFQLTALEILRAPAVSSQPVNRLSPRSTNRRPVPGVDSGKPRHVRHVACGYRDQVANAPHQDGLSRQNCISVERVIAGRWQPPAADVSPGFGCLMHDRSRDFRIEKAMGQGVETKKAP